MTKFQVSTSDSPSIIVWDFLCHKVLIDMEYSIINRFVLADIKDTEAYNFLKPLYDKYGDFYLVKGDYKVQANLC